MRYKHKMEECRWRRLSERGGEKTKEEVEENAKEVEEEM